MFESSIGLSTGPSIGISTSLATNPFILPVRTRALYHPTSSPTPSFSSPRPRLSSRPPLLQFIFQFAPRSSQVCARRKFAETAGTPWRPHGGGTRGKQSSSVLLFYHEPPCHAPSHSFFFIFLPYTCSLLSSSVSSVSSLPGYTGPQGDLILAQVPNPPIYTHTHASLSTCPAAALPPLSVSFSLPGGKTVRPSSPKLSISDGVYLQRDRPTHLECIFTSVHTPSPSHSFNIAHVCHKTNPCSSLRGSGSLSG